ncbi:BnaA06g24630D [Brassica napus]|uniref:(rape) hypothetical protein n=1 Tax=Brassica napus TaxID=3708 RepID=A0A078F5S0_BRANA|nr:unnamed protein product [Brassica napus]CDY08761.1 BnaA06g24630D [Brassica napus]
MVLCVSCSVLCLLRSWSYVGLIQLVLHRDDRLQDNMNPQVVNILKGGIVYSNKVVIMSA